MIVFSNVTKQFGDNPPAVEDVSFEVEEGEFLFLTGHSGSGKTTLLKLLTKEYVANDGEIEFYGQPLSKVKNSKLHHHRRQIGVVYQDYRLLPELNVWENVALALEIIGKPQREIEERVTDLLDLVQLTDKAYFFPAELSGGESQRVGIARALATAPTVLLADEPTGNLDPENTVMIARLFNKIHELGTTIFFATHDLLVLDSLGHRRLKMEKGRLVEDAPAKPGVAKKKPVASPELDTKDKPVDKKPTSEKVAEKTPPKVAKKAEPVVEKDNKKTTKAAVENDQEPESVSKDEKPAKKGRRFPSIHFPLFGRKKKDKQEAVEEPIKKSDKNDKPPIGIVIEEL